jgi:hypothetical protein
MMRKMAITQSLIMKLVPRMDCILGPTLKSIGIYIILEQIGINTWIYIKNENALKILYPYLNYDSTNGFMVRNRANLTAKMSNYVTTNPMPHMGSLPHNACHYSLQL